MEHTNSQFSVSVFSISNFHRLGRTPFSNVDVDLHACKSVHSILGNMKRLTSHRGRHSVGSVKLDGIL